MAFWNLIAKISADSTGFKVGAKQAESALDGLMKKADGLKGTLATAFGFYGLKEFISSTIGDAKEVRQLAEQFGVSAEEAQKLEKAADDAGVSMGSLFSAFNSFESAREAAIKGNSEVQESFKNMGFSMKELENPARRTIDFLSKLNDSGNAESRNAARDILGARGLKSLAAIKGFDSKEARWSNEDVSFLDEFGRQFSKEGKKRLTKFLKGIQEPPVDALPDDPFTNRMFGKPGSLMRGIGVAGSQTIRDLSDLLFGTSLSGKTKPADDDFVKAEAEMEAKAADKEKKETFYEKQKREKQEAIQIREEAKKTEELQKLQYETAFKKLGPMEQELQLKQEIKDLQDVLQDQEESGIDALDTRIELQKKELQLLGIKSEEGAKSRVGAPASALQRIGALGAGDSAANTLREQLTVQKRMASDISKLASSDGGNQFS